MADQEPKKKLIAGLLCWFIPGGHRFYTGHTGTGIAMLLTGGGCGIWTIIDLIAIIQDKFLDANGNPLAKD